MQRVFLGVSEGFNEVTGEHRGIERSSGSFLGFSVGFRSVKVSFMGILLGCRCVTGGLRVFRVIFNLFSRYNKGFSDVFRGFGELKKGYKRSKRYQFLMTFEER